MLLVGDAMGMFDFTTSSLHCFQFCVNAAEKEVLAMISSFVMALEGPRAESDSGSASVRRCVYPDAGA